MSEAAEKLKPVLAALPPEDRAELTRFLAGLPDAEPADEWDEEYVAELNRRVADYESGKDPGVPAEEVFRKLRERHG